MDAILTTRKITTFRIDEHLLDGLRIVTERDGITVPEQVRRAIQDWLDKKGVKKKAERKRASTRKRP
jgi:hypothetical protein